MYSTHLLRKKSETRQYESEHWILIHGKRDINHVYFTNNKASGFNNESKRLSFSHNCSISMFFFFGVLSPSLYIHGIGVNNLNILHPALRMILLEIIVIVLHLILRWQVAVTGRIE